MNQRIKDISDAAAKLFLQQGYAKTQIGHIAKAVGVSVGTIYLDFAGKKEIMHFILKCIIEPDFVEREFERPITDDLFVGLEKDIIELFGTLEKDFSVHLSEHMADYTFEMLISDTFDLFSRYGAGCLFIEKNQYDFKNLAKHYGIFRKNFFDTMTRYMRAFIDRGILRPLDHVELSAVMIIEILSWWAMDMRYTSFETANISVDLAKQICMDNILNAYKK